MKIFLPFLFGIILLLGCETLLAQSYNAQLPIFKTLNKRERSQFLSHLKTLTNSLNLNNQLQQDIFADLKQGLPVANPGAGIDGMLEAWSTGRLSIQGFLSDHPAEFDNAAIQSILGVYDTAQLAWSQNLQRLQQDYSLYKDSLQVSPAAVNEAEQTYTASYTDLKTQLDEQNQNFTVALLSNSNSLNQRNWSEVADNLLHQFGDLAIGIGTQKLLASYYEETPDSLTTTLIRFGSMPNFDQTWTADWDAWVSFKVNSSTAGATENAASSALNISPYLAGGTVSFNYQPSKSFSFGELRLIAGVGGTLESYLPARINPSKPQSLNNQGNTTGFGPHVRLGFAAKVNNLYFYSYSSVAKGWVFHADDYSFNNWKIISGLQWKWINLRFAHGNSNWALSNDKNAQYSEFSLNIRL